MNRLILKFIFILLIVLFQGFSLAQAPDTLWTRSFGFREYEQAVGAFQLPSGGFLVGGYQQDTSNYDYAGWLFKVDANGNILTENHTGYDNLDEQLNSMSPASDNTFVLTGSAEHPENRSELYAVKVDSNGTMLNSNRLGGINNHIGNGVIALPDGQCRFVGELQTTPHKGLLYGTFSNLSFMFHNVYPIGASLDLYAINLTMDSCLIITGKIQPTPGDSRFIFLMKTDFEGSCILNQLYGFGGDDQIGYWVESTLDGGYIVCGYTTVDGILNNRDLYIVKVDSLLQREWTKRYAQSEGRMIINHPEGGYVVTGYYYGGGGGLLVMRLDENGDSIWTKIMPGGGGNSISLTADGGYIIAGVTSYTTEKKFDAFLVRLEPELIGNSSEEIFNLMDFFLYQNYPNPFNPSTTIQFDIPKASFVTLKVYNLLGQDVATLVNEDKQQGRYEVVFQSAVGSRQYASGVYFYRLVVSSSKVGSNILTGKMILIK